MTDATTAVSLPLFYKEPVAINAETHREVTVSPSPAGYVFATKDHTVMLNEAEFIEAGHEYPIIFSSGADGSAGPRALLGLALMLALDTRIDAFGNQGARLVAQFPRIAQRQLGIAA